MAGPGAQSAIQIVSAALAYLGGRPMSGFADVGAQQVGAEAVYTMVRNAELYDYPWHFACREKLLTPLAELGSEFSTRYEYAYSLPEDCLRSVGLESYEEHVTSGGELYTNDSAPNLLYIALVDESYFPAGFCRALSWRVAEALAVAMTGSKDKGNYCFERAEHFFGKARSADSDTATNQDLAARIEEMLAAPTRPRR